MTKRTKEVGRVQVGKVFGNLTVVEVYQKRGATIRGWAICACNCGLENCKRFVHVRQDALGVKRRTCGARITKQSIVTPGAHFGNLAVTGVERSCDGKYLYALCECYCGRPGCTKTTRTRVDHLINGSTTGCKACSGKWKHTYAAKQSPHRQALLSWEGMFWRCDHPEHKAYSRYGGRGITICQRWRDSFEAFLADMGDPPDGMTLDRIDNDGNYEPSNCRWATRQQQQRNRSGNRMLTLDGEEYCVAEWSEKIGIPRDVLYDRVRLGWDDERIIRTPYRPKSRYGAAAFRAPTHLPRG